MTFRSGGLWRTGYEVDLTTLANQNIRTGGNGNKTIDGKVWLWANDANCASANVVNGQGIVIVASATATGFYEGTIGRSAPNLTLPVLSAVPNFDICQNVLRVTTRMVLTNADTPAEGGKLFVEYVTTPENQNVSIGKLFSAGSLGFIVNDALNPTFTQPYPFNTSASDDDILSIIFWPNKGWETYSGLHVAGEKMRLRTARLSFWQNTGTPSIRFNTDVRLGICQVTNNATGSLTTTFTHLRVDYHDRHPAQ